MKKQFVVTAIGCIMAIPCLAQSDLPCSQAMVLERWTNEMDFWKDETGKTPKPDHYFVKDIDGDGKIDIVLLHQKIGHLAIFTWDPEWESLSTMTTNSDTTTDFGYITGDSRYSLRKNITQWDQSVSTELLFTKLDADNNEVQRGYMLETVEGDKIVESEYKVDGKITTKEAVLQIQPDMTKVFWVRKANFSPITF